MRELIIISAVVLAGCTGGGNSCQVKEYEIREYVNNMYKYTKCYEETCPNDPSVLKWCRNN